MARLSLQPQKVQVGIGQFELTSSMNCDLQNVLSDEEIAHGAARIQLYSHWPKEDLALYYMLLNTGACPLEIARLEISDYLDFSGRVRGLSAFRKEVAINGRSRPLYFGSRRLERALDVYLDERRRRGHGLGPDSKFRGLNPGGRLFSSASGDGYKITFSGAEGQKRFSCRAIQETYRKIFRHAGLKGMTALSVRHTVAARLYARGANDEQVALLLGISKRSALRRMFARQTPSLDEIMHEFV